MTSKASAIVLYQCDDFENLSHRVILNALGEWEERFWNLNKQKTFQIFPGLGGEEGMNKEQRLPENIKVQVNLARQSTD